MKKHYLALVIAAACSGMSTQSLAQENATATDDTQTDTPVLEEVITIGNRDAIARALNRQRNAGGVINVIDKDAMGKLQDDNLGEALQRVPGLSIERDQGEGRFIRIRGLAPDLNSVSYNGTVLAAPEAGRRAVALDVIPSDLLESVEVNKTLSPDMAAGSLGGNVEIKSMTAFDRENDFYSLTTELGYNQQASETNPKISGVVSKKFDVGNRADAFGFAFAASFQDRSFATDNVETGGSWDFDEPGLEELEQRAYQVNRERTGLALNLDFRPTADSDYFLKSLYSEFADTETRNGLITEFAEPLEPDASSGAELKRELKDRKETQEITALVLGTEQRMGDWTLNLEAGTSKASEDQPFAIGGAAFVAEFDEGVGFSGRKALTLNAPDAAYQADSFELDEVEVSNAYTEETEQNVKFDLAYDMLRPNYQITWKAGMKVSEREKTAAEDIYIYEDFADNGVTALSLADYQSGTVDYGLDRFGPGIDAGALFNLLDTLNADDFFDEVESNIGDYEINEDIYAGYLMADIQSGRWQVITGARYEYDKRNGLGVRYDDELGEFTDRADDFSNGRWLPSFITRFDWTEDTIVRAAVSSGMVRPSFEQIRPSYYIENDDGDIKAEFGNPDLKPLTSTNLDLGIEHYDDTLGVLSAMAFYKSIENFVYEADLAGRAGYETFDEAVTFVNGDDAYVYGIELNAVHQLRGFDNFWDNFLLSTNLTFSESEATVDWLADGELVSRDIPLPSQSDTTANVQVAYETNNVSLRLAANFKSKYLVELGDIEDSRYDIYEDNNMTVDFSANWMIREGMSITFSANNLTNEPFFVYSGRRDYNAQYESYGRSYTLGLQLAHW